MKRFTRCNLESWRYLWLATGLLWFLVAITWSPSNKLYQQRLIVLLWIPALLSIVGGRERIIRHWQDRRFECVALIALVAWSAVSLVWSSADEPMRELRRLLFVVLFLLGVDALGSRRQLLMRVLVVAGWLLAGAVAVSIIVFYGVRGNSWLARIQGLGQLAHPILGGYVMGGAAVWMSALMPNEGKRQVMWLPAFSALLAFLALSQSRGAVLAVLLVMLLAPFWKGGRQAWVVSVGSALMAALGYWLFEPLVTARGASYRPEIIMASLDLIANAPWTGLGLGTGYDIRPQGMRHVFDHTHNLPLHIAVELGLPALLIWLGLWGAIVWRAWQARNTALGKVVLGVWLYASFAMQVDAASIWDSARAEWFVSWLPLALGAALLGPGRVDPGSPPTGCTKVSHKQAS